MATRRYVEILAMGHEGDINETNRVIRILGGQLLQWNIIPVRVPLLQPPCHARMCTDEGDTSLGEFLENLDVKLLSEVTRQDTLLRKQGV